MTSDALGECFVYVTLPGETEPVTAGRFVLSVDRRDVPEGRFVHGRRDLERPDAVALGPVELKLAQRLQTCDAPLRQADPPSRSPGR
jgi:serine/threonine-protein kinase HipA